MARTQLQPPPHGRWWVRVWLMLPGSCDKTIVDGITYNEFGQTAGFTLGNGIATSYTYDIKGRLARIVSSGEVDGTTKTLQNAVYTFNEQNNITHVENNASDYETSYSYGYDGLNRLTTASGRYVETLNATGTADTVPKQFQQSYSYADNGNLTSKRIHDPASGSVTDEWTYRYANHAVTRIDSTKSGGSTIAMDYDESGNMVEQIDTAKSANKRIEVDSQDRIVRVRNGANNAIMGEYVYDEGGFRVRKSARFAKAGLTQDVEILYPSKFYGLEYSSEANTLSSVNNIYLNGVRIAALNEGGGTAYYLTDQVDSVSTVLDDEGKTLSRIQYQPYGETFVHKGDTDFSPKYNSQELDKETNFYFYNARYYDPAVARFTSADTVIPNDLNTQSWNKYSYVEGNPIRYKDPTGHAPEDVAEGASEEAKDWAIENLKFGALNLLCMACAGAKQTVDLAEGLASVIADPKAALDEVTKDVREINSDDEKVGDTAKGRVAVKLVRAIVEAVIAKKAGGAGPKAKAPAKPPVSTVAESPAGGGNPAPAKPKPTKPPVQGKDGVPLTAEQTKAINEKIAEAAKEAVKKGNETISRENRKIKVENYRFQKGKKVQLKKGFEDMFDFWPIKE